MPILVTASGLEHILIFPFGVYGCMLHKIVFFSRFAEIVEETSNGIGTRNAEISFRTRENMNVYYLTEIPLKCEYKSVMRW